MKKFFISLTKTGRSGIYGTTSHVCNTPEQARKWAQKTFPEYGIARIFTRPNERRTTIFMADVRAAALN